jgi:hypothetical protein
MDTSMSSNTCMARCLPGWESTIQRIRLKNTPSEQCRDPLTAGITAMSHVSVGHDRSSAWEITNPTCQFFDWVGESAWHMSSVIFLGPAYINDNGP